MGVMKIALKKQTVPSGLIFEFARTKTSDDAAHWVMNQAPHLQNDRPMCSTCRYVLPSETSSTGLRCGIRYFNSTLFMRKLQLMHHFPEIRPENACESWQQTPPVEAGRALV
jgi:hypothetical protein